MKKIIFLLLTACMLLPSCATILGGKKTELQAHKPAEGRRELREGYIVLDLLFTGGIGLVIDFLTEKIYEPVPDRERKAQPLKE